MPATYREIGAAACVTDADRVMILKIFWEHADYCHLFLEEHVAHNFEVGVLLGLLNMAVTFPEFRDSKKLARTGRHAFLRQLARLHARRRRIVQAHGLPFRRLGGIPCGITASCSTRAHLCRRPSRSSSSG